MVAHELEAEARAGAGADAERAGDADVAALVGGSPQAAELTPAPATGPRLTSTSLGLKRQLTPLLSNSGCLVALLCSALLIHTTTWVPLALMVQRPVALPIDNLAIFFLSKRTVA